MVNKLPMKRMFKWRITIYRIFWEIMHSMETHSIMNKKYRSPTTHNYYEQVSNLVKGIGTPHAVQI